MTSFDYRLNPLYLIKECSSYRALYSTDYCCSVGILGDKIICDLDKTPDLSQRSPQTCPKCGNPVYGHYCQGCALLREKFKEDLFASCVKNGILQDSFGPSNDNFNVANALRDPFVVNLDNGNNSSQSPPQISNHYCYGCGDPLEGIFCRQCTCKLCVNGAHYGYNCPPKVPIIPDPEPFNNQTIKELPPTVQSSDPKSDLVHNSPNVFSPSLQPSIYSYEFCGNDAYYGQDCSLQSPVFHQPPQEMNIQEMEDLKQHMGDEHLDTIPETESDEFINSSVENLIPIPRGIDDDILLTIKDDILHEELLNINLLIAKIEALNDSPTPSFDFMTKSSSTSLNSLLEETNSFDNSLPKFKTFFFNVEEISSGSTTTRSGISLPEYEAFYDDHVKDISSGSTTTRSGISLPEYEAFYDDHVKDISSGSNTTHSDSYLYDSFIFDLSINLFSPADRSDFYKFADELIHIISLPEYDCFFFKIEPNSGNFTMDVVEDISLTREPRVHNDLPTIPPFN
nr:hypothetical protein [Tanacetum cinerariifolium]